MFVREKQSRGNRYLYLVENRREGGKVRQKVIAYLGTGNQSQCRTVEGALAYWTAIAKRLREKEAAAREKMSAGAPKWAHKPRKKGNSHVARWGWREYWRHADDAEHCGRYAADAEAKVATLAAVGGTT